MNQSEVNRIITEKVLGKCWHEYPEDTDFVQGMPIGLSANGPLKWEMAICIKCNDQPGEYNPDFSTWQDWGRALEWAQGLEWIWEKFMLEVLTEKGVKWGKQDSDYAVFDVGTLLNPTKGSQALAEFITRNPDLFGKEEVIWTRENPV